jgi:predicted Zn-dependent protease
MLSDARAIRNTSFLPMGLGMRLLHPKPAASNATRPSAALRSGSATDTNADANAEPLPLETGLAHLREGRWHDAVVALRLALQREPGRLAAVRALASAYVQSGDLSAARALLESFTAENPMNAQGWQLAAQLEWKLNERTRAIEIVAAALVRLPNEPALHRQQAIFLAAAGKLPEAAAHAAQCEPAKAASGENDRVRTYLAAAVGDGGRPRNLLRPIEHAGPAQDHDWLDQIARDSVLLEALLRFDQDTFTADAPPDLSPEHRQMLVEIEAKLSRVLESQPRHADRHLLLARLQARLASYPAALLSVQRALRANPKLIAAHRLRALIHFRIGQVAGAIEILQQLQKGGLAWPDIHYEMAALEQHRGRGGEARGHLYDAIRMNPNFQQARELLERCAA